MGYYDAVTDGTQYYTNTGVASGASGKTMLANQTLYARWTPSTYTITYQGMENATPGTDCPTQHVYGTTSHITDPTKAISGSSYEDVNGTYTFMGWSVNGGVTVYKDLTLGATQFTGPITLTANWLKQKVAEVTKGDGDATVTKTVIKPDQSQTVTNLPEIPVPIDVVITLPAAQQGLSDYSVYRYHTYDGAGEIHVISDNPEATEYFTVNEDKTAITVHTRMFSTFAVAASVAYLDARPIYEKGKPSTGVNVQGKITQKGLEAVYKLDVEWGAMTFGFTTAKEWDPYNHTYGEPSYAWSEDSFQGGNNRIKVINHSNSDVSATITFARETGQLDGTDVTFHVQNSALSEKVTSMYLQKVPEEGAEPKEAYAYLWLKGTPTTLPTQANASYEKMGVITLTFAGNKTLGLTPKNN